MRSGVELITSHKGDGVKMTHKVIVQSDVGNFVLELENRITIIDDDSGTKKTLLWNILRNYPNNHAKLQTDCNLAAISVLEEIKDDSVNNIYILDEDAKCLEPKCVNTFLEIVKNSHSFFVIITRENKLVRLPYSIDSIYRLVKHHKVYKLQRAYGKFYENNSLQRIQKIIVEDSTTGLAFFKKIKYNSETMKGKDNWRSIRGKNLDGVLIVIDACGFGACVKDFRNFRKQHPELQILDYQSFESFLLEQLDIQCDASLQYNKEDYYTKAIHKSLPQYGKTDKCPCLFYCKCTDCNYKNVLQDSIQVFKQSKYADYVRW